MNVVIVTEGTAEYKSLPLIYPQLHSGCTRTKIVRTLLVNISPEAPPRSIARRCVPSVRIAAGLGANLVVLALDREQQRECCGRIAETIRKEILSVTGIPASMRIEVVLKDRKFENWLIADLDALKAQPGRFLVTAAIEKSVMPDKADKCDGERTIKRAVRAKYSYDKTEDGVRILTKMNIGTAAANSRSFRHFLHVLRCRPYVEGCSQPQP